jgi:Tfp pilus assembly protein PilF
VVWGPGAFGPHLTNLLLHAAAAAVFFDVARRLLGGGEDADLPAAFSALLFAAHPLRAESVAWAIERRDCLSGLLYLLTLRFWLQDRVRPALACYAASLLAKGIGVTLPVALALVDAVGRGRALDRAWLRRAAPFCALALGFGFFGLWAQRVNGAGLPLSRFSLSSRLAVASYGLWFYPLKTVLPAGLIPLYPLPKPLPTLSQFPYGPAFVCALGAAALVWRKRRDHPGLAACALFYAATVAPVLGALRFGPQLVADRYSYLSCLPLALLAGEALRRARADAGRRKTAEAAAAAVVLLLTGLTSRQVLFWRDSDALWRRELAVRQDVPLAHHFLANEAMARGDFAGAEESDRAALAEDPRYAPSLNGLGLSLTAQGRVTEAQAQFKAALAAKPDYWEAANNMGLALGRAGRYDEAAAAFRKALELAPDNPGVHGNLGLALLSAGREKDGLAELDAALALDPDQPRLAAIREQLKSGTKSRF